MLHYFLYAWIVNAVWATCELHLGYPLGTGTYAVVYTISSYKDCPESNAWEKFVLKCPKSDVPVSPWVIKKEKDLLVRFTKQYGNESELVPSWDVPPDMTLTQHQGNINLQHCFFMKRLNYDGYQFAEREGHLSRQTLQF